MASTAIPRRRWSRLQYQITLMLMTPSTTAGPNGQRLNQALVHPEGVWLVAPYRDVASLMQESGHPDWYTTTSDGRRIKHAKIKPVHRGNGVWEAEIHGEGDLAYASKSSSVARDPGAKAPRASTRGKRAAKPSGKTR